MARTSRHLAAAACLLVAACSGGGSEDGFCTTAAEFAEDNPALVFDQIDPSQPAEAASLLRAEAERLRSWGDESPSSLRVDIDVIADAADEIADGIESPPTNPDRLAELEARFTEVELASARITAAARDRCGVELDPAPAS